MANDNRVKSKLRAGGTVFGTWTQCASPTVANVLAHAGLDFVTIDMEHGPASFETAESMLFAIEAGGSTGMIRLGEGSGPTILRAVDIGCQGILVAHVSDAAEADRIVRATRYHPAGDRGLAPFTRTHGYSEEGLADKLREANEQMLTGILIEDEQGFENLDAILAVPNLDLVYIGVYDLSQSVGHAGQLDHPRVVEAVKDCIARVEAAGLAAGAVARSREHLAFQVECGFRYISYLVDTAILYEGFDRARGWFRELVPA